MRRASPFFVQKLTDRSSVEFLLGQTYFPYSQRHLFRAAFFCRLS